MHAIMASRGDAAGNIIARRMAARHGLGFAQNARARRHIIIIGLRRRRHACIGEAQILRRIFGQAAKAYIISLFIKGDGLDFATCHIGNVETR